MVFLAWLRRLRVADGAAELVLSELAEPVLRPLGGMSRVQIPTRFFRAKLAVNTK
jgi:hypothetical protein